MTTMIDSITDLLLLHVRKHIKCFIVNTCMFTL